MNYPSADDLRTATLDGRDAASLGGDIMIHGGAASIGCVALGDPAIEELFWLASCVELDRIDILLAPNLAPGALVHEAMTPWLQERYADLEARLRQAGL